MESISLIFTLAICITKALDHKTATAEGTKIPAEAHDAGKNDVTFTNRFTAGILYKVSC
jgi:hypothetical protein